MKIVFYTIFMGADGNIANNIPLLPSTKHDCFYISNNVETLIRAKGIGYKTIDASTEFPISTDANVSAMSAKKYKSCPWELAQLREYEYTCYFDSKITPDGAKIQKIIEDMLQQGPVCMLLRRHPFLGPCIYNEYRESLLQERYMREENKQRSFITANLQKGLKHTIATHYATGLIIRRCNTESREIDKEWFEAIKLCGIECQVSFFFVQQLHPLEIMAIPEDKWYR